MGAMASQITSPTTIVYSTIYTGVDQRKHQSSASPASEEFPAQMASNAENVSIWWRHYEHGVPVWKALTHDFQYGQVCVSSWQLQTPYAAQAHR